MRIEGIKSLRRTLLKRRRRGATARASVNVGYTQSYAVHVHENLDAFHHVGQAKFLEQPARELAGSGELGRIVSNAYVSHGGLGDALVIGGLRLQRASQQLVPIDTGALKASAFTRRDAN